VLINISNRVYHLGASDEKGRQKSGGAPRPRTERNLPIIGATFGSSARQGKRMGKRRSARRPLVLLVCGESGADKVKGGQDSKPGTRSRCDDRLPHEPGTRVDGSRSRPWDNSIRVRAPRTVASADVRLISFVKKMADGSQSRIIEYFSDIQDRTEARASSPLAGPR